MAPAFATSFVLSEAIAELFFDTTNSLTDYARDFTKTNGVDANVNGQDCYVLTGEANHQDLLAWVNKKTFLISQIELVLGSKPLTDADVKSLPKDQRAMVLTYSKIKGTVTETYDNIQVNRNLTASAFESSYQPAPSTEPIQRRRPTSMADRLANPRRNQGP
jgi:outer membrane lipoprotein-sorting protein